jgi:hypothetical protein
MTIFAERIKYDWGCGTCIVALAERLLLIGSWKCEFVPVQGESKYMKCQRMCRATQELKAEILRLVSVARQLAESHDLMHFLSGEPTS